MSSKQLGMLLTFADILAIVVTGVGVMVLHPVLQISSLEYLTVIGLYCFLYVLIGQKADLLSVENIVRPYQTTRRLFVVLILIFSLMIVLFFALKVSIDFSRVWAFGWLISMLVALTLNRIIFKKLAHTTTNKKVAVFGAGEQGQFVLNNANNADAIEYEVVGLFDDRTERTEKIVAGHKLLGTTEDLIEFATTNECDQIILAIPWFAAERIAEIMAKLRVLSIDVSLAPDLAALRFPVKLSNDLGFPVFDISVKPLSDLESLLKRCADTVLASIGLLLMLPVFIITAIAIKLDSKGPIFFVQRRYGFNRRPLMVYKFRTMKVDSQDDNAEVLATRNDPRVTRVGRFLRKSSIDELPQLLNVLKGGMSMVGPRPHPTRAKAGGTLYLEAVATYAMRYRVKPGITGWAQVNGWRGETDTHEKLERRVEHDLFYIENWTPKLDLVILLRTIWVCALGRNAY